MTQAAVPDFSRARVLVVGDIMLDRYWSGPVPRISPEAPVPVVQIRKNEDRPGGAANVALNLAALGVQTQLLGVVGDDEPAKQLNNALALANIKGKFLITPQRPTITKLRVLSRNQQLIRLDFEEALDAVGGFDREELKKVYAETLTEVDVVVLSDYAKGTLVDVAQLISIARAQNKQVVVDPKGLDFSRYAGATCLTPNRGELEAIVGPCEEQDLLVEKAQALREQLQLQALLVTRSEQGMSLLREGVDALHMPTQAQEVFDVTGAGDTVIAVLAAAIASGQDLAQAARLANFGAGIVVGKIGTATASPAELQRAVRSQHAEDSAILDEPDLLQRVAEARAHGETVVMTNGCFDLLHVGHVRYLEAARKLGDVLIVAVNDDDSVRRLKGEQRPLNPVADRMRMLSALKCVDWVVPFGEDTPQRLIAAVLPDRLVKGGDYQPEQIAGYQEVTAHGGQVVVLDFHAGYSTTSMIERARKS